MNKWASDEQVGLMQAITILGLCLCLGVLFLRARQAPKQPPRSLAQRLGTVHVVVVALLAWLAISFHLQHLNRALSGETQAPQSNWERVTEFFSK
jgi:putative copper export protein